MFLNRVMSSHFPLSIALIFLPSSVIVFTHALLSKNIYHITILVIFLLLYSFDNYDVRANTIYPAC